MPSIVDSTDFTANALSDNNVTVTRTSVTKVLLSSGTDKPATYRNEKSGDVKEIDGYIMVGPTQTINKNDKITYNSIDYIVWDVVVRGPSGDVALYKYCPILLREA